MPAAQQQQVADSFAALLRQSTAPQHTQLESTRLSTSLLSAEVSLENYTAYLAAMQPVIAFCEHTIFPIINAVITDIHERRKLAWIQQDLAYFHRYAAKTNFLPLENKISTAFALGYMYVIEGSVLGGRVILKHLHKQLGITGINGGAFFAGYGELTGSKWKKFMQMLLAYENECNCGQEIIEGARHAFESIYKYFEQVQYED